MSANHTLDLAALRLALLDLRAFVGSAEFTRESWYDEEGVAATRIAYADLGDSIESSLRQVSEALPALIEVAEEWERWRGIERMSEIRIQELRAGVNRLRGALLEIEHKALDYDGICTDPFVLIARIALDEVTTP